MLDDAAISALLAACVADDSDAPRLVLADLLLGVGDVRGELLDLECRLAALDPDDPARDRLEGAAIAKWDDACTAWAARCAEPALTFGSREPEFGLPGVSIRFRRGLPEHVELDLGVTSSLAPWLVEHPVRELHLMSPATRDLATIERLAPLARVRDLRVFTAVSFDVVEELCERAPALESLTLSGPVLVNDGALARWLARRPPALARLRSFSVGDLALDADSAAVVAEAGYARSLATLELWLVRWDQRARELFAERIASTVTSATLATHIDLDAAWARAWVASGTWSRLESFTANYASLEADALDVLIDAPAPALRSLKLEGVGAVKLRLGAFGRAPWWRALEALDVGMNRLDAGDLRSLLDGDGPLALRRLALTGNEVGDEGVRMLTASPRLPRLRTLGLLFCGAVDEDGRSLSKLRLP